MYETTKIVTELQAELACHLYELIKQADRDNARMRTEIARNDQIKASAQHRLIGLQLQEQDA
ncbi:hypothetical protein [Burkholderia sp. WTPI3]|uniref:hypothetical protein n=1 Tax=Burkholderia sp. WTPI3 TaxID=2822167 RepID=UPI001F253024|nr:hypothetical protein [Burkholderia sp. WTPI3]